MKRSLALFISLLMVLYIVPFSQIVSASDNSEIPEDNIEFVYPDEHLAGTETLTAASSFAYGDGSSANPYIIATPEEFAYFNSLCALETNTSSKYFSLANDIDLTVYSNESQTVTLGNRYFSGNFDGNGFTIIMTGDVSTGYLESSKTKGVFGENKGTVKNLNLSFEKLYFGAQYNGTVAGINAGTIENVVVTIATVVMISEYGNGRLQYFGGIVGENSNGVIKDCHFKGLIKSNSSSVYDAAPSQYVGGIAGKGGEIYNCSVKANSNSLLDAVISIGNEVGECVFYIGGIVGVSYIVENSGVYGPIGGPADIDKYTGGIAGTTDSRGYIKNCNAYVYNIDGGTYVGGIVGFATANIYNCYADIADGVYAQTGAKEVAYGGWIAGACNNENTSLVKNCHYTLSEYSEIIRTDWVDGGCDDDYLSDTVRTVPATSKAGTSAPSGMDSSFLQNTLGWGLHKSYSDMVANKNNVWRCTNWAYLYTTQLLTVRYLDESGKAFAVKSVRVEGGEKCNIPSPEREGAVPDILVVSGTYSGRKIIDVHYNHEHAPGAEPTCTTPQTCTLCGAVLAEKLPHPYAPNVVSPTCEEQGYTVNTCTVCGDSYTDNYTSPTGHSFVNDNNMSDGYTCDICGKNFPSLLFTYTISFYDYESGKPVPEVNATLGGTSLKSGADGSVSFQIPEGTEKTSLVIEAKGYPTISENEYVLNTAFTDTIILESNETNIHSAYCNGDNVLTGSTQINAHAGLYKAKIAVGGTAKGEILKYEIIQGDNVIAVSTDGKFEIYNPAFTPKEAVTAKMYVQTVNGIITRERELNIKVIGVTFDIKTGLEDLLGMDFGVKLSFPNGTPLLEGINLQVPFDKDYTYSVHIGNNKIIATVGYGKNLLKKPSDDDDKSAKEILKELTDKWVSEQKKSKKIEPGVNASFVFEIGEDGISKVYGELQVSIGMQYNVGKTFMLWIIPVYGEIDMKFDGSVNVNNLGFDIENSKIIVPSLEIELDGSIALYAGVGIPAASVGVYGELGIDLILSTENETFLKRFTIYGEMGVYAKLRLLFFKEWCYHYCFLRGEYTWPQNPTSFSLPKELLSPDAYSDSQRTYLENRSEWLGEKIPLGEALSSFKALQTSVSDAVEPKLVTCGDDIMMLFLDDDGSEGYNYQHLFFSLYNSETNTWSEPRRVDSNAYPDIEFDAYSDGNDIYIVYTESDEITEDNKENEISVISSIEVSAARFDFDNVGFVGYQRLTDNEIIDTLPQIVCDSEIVYASWVSNPTDDVFAQNANNIVNVSACISGEWGEPYVLSDRGATVTSCDLGVLNGKTLLALVRDIDCNFETFDDRALSFIDMNGNVYNVETSVFQNDGVRFVKRGGKTELMWYNGGFVYTVDSLDAVPENPFGNSLSGIEPDFVYTELENGTSVLVYSKGTIHNLLDGSQVNGSDLFALFIEENGEANDPINLSNLSDGRYISAFDVAPLGNKLVAPYISTLAVFGDEEEFKTENDFMFALFEQTTDISVEDVFVSPESIFDGDSFEIEFNVRNGSWYSASFDYSVVDSENNALLSGSYNGDLVSGETASVAVSLEKALLSADKAYYIVVTPKDIYDSNETNNRAPIALWYSDLSVEAKQILLPSGLEIQYLVSNDGNSSANGVLKIYKEDENGNLTELYSESLKKLSAGESVSGAVAVTDSFFRNGEEKGIVLVRIEYENEEIYSFNDSVYLSVGGIKKTETKDPDANQTTVNNPTLEPPYVQYDKKNGGDVNISVIENGCSFVELIDVDSSNYSYSNGVLSVKESYLRSLESGNYHFYLKYNAGDRFIDILLIIDVSTSAYSDVSLTADDQTVKYDGFAVDIADDLEYSTVSKGEASASYSLNGTDWISGLPTDIGVYKVRLFVGEDHENGYLSAECEFVLTIVKGTRAISIPTVISEESVNVLFGNSLVTAGDTDGTILYGYSLINDVETVETWSESGVLPESENDAVYYIFAKIVGGALYEDAFSLGGIAEAHVHSYIQTVTEPDCETEGYTTYTCRCGDSFVDDYVAAKGHTWIDDPEAPPACYTGGTKLQVCLVCGEKTSSSTAVEHIDVRLIVESEATCIEDGISYYYCFECDSQVGDIIIDPAFGHSMYPIGIVNDNVCHDGEYTLYGCYDCEQTYKEYITPPGHDYQNTVTDPICELGGYTIHTCSRCGDSYVDDFTDPLGHVSKGNATCTENCVCAICGEILEGKLGHNYVSVITEPDCELGGYTTHTCSRCGDSYNDSYTQPLGHKAGVEATCTADQVCTVCRKTLVSALGHKYETEITEPSCESSGFTTHTCMRCGNVSKDSFTKPLGHKMGAEATCIADQICTVCKKVLVYALGHSYETVVTKPTGDDAGYTTYTCTRCKHSYKGDFVAPLGHNAGAEATCTTAQTCVDCGKVLVDALGHEYDAVVTEPTCESGGYTVHTCSRCGDSYTDSLTEALGHRAGSEATCTTAQTCVDCGKVLVDALGHKYDSAIIDPTCETGGYTTHTCSRCGDSYTDSLTEALGHREGSEATCTTAQICVNCGKVLVIALGHEYDAVVTSPTCETGGYTTHTCSRCGDRYTDSLTEALGHEESEWVIVTEAGLETEGLKEKRCKTCSELLESEIIEPIGYRVGDVNMNGRIDATDYALVKRHCLKTFTLNEKQQLLADVNGNGRVDATDYALIKRHCLKTFDIYA